MQAYSKMIFTPQSPAPVFICSQATENWDIGVELPLLIQKSSENIRWECSWNVFMESFLNIL